MEREEWREGGKRKGERGERGEKRGRVGGRKGTKCHIEVQEKLWVVTFLPLGKRIKALTLNFNVKTMGGNTLNQ